MSQNSKEFASRQQAALSGMKGHMCLKSSPFAPTQNKLSSQYMVVDQMNSHYRKILSAKSSIDMSTPKSTAVSQKARDTAKRAAIQKGVASPRRPQNKSRPVDNGNKSIEFNEDDFNSASMKDMALVESLVNETLTERNNNNETKPNIMRYNQSYVSAPRVQQQLMRQDSYNPAPYDVNSLQTMQSGASKWGISAGSRRPTTPRRSQGGDVLDTRKHKFTESSQPFTPRTLKTEGTSRLSQYKYYRPPKQAAAKNVRAADERSETPGTENGDSVMLDETLMSRDFNRLRSSGTVPPLDISLDADHMKWLKEQSVNAQTRIDTSERLPETQREYVKSEGSRSSQKRMPLNKQTSKVPPYVRQTSNMSNTRTFERPASSQTFSRSFSSGTMQKVKDEEEELKYLNFVTDVTNDVLTRGIFTNRVLKQVFEHHINNKKHELKISRMRALLDTLREDLGIPTNSEEYAGDVGTGTASDTDFGMIPAQPLPVPRRKERTPTHSTQYRPPARHTNGQGDLDLSSTQYRPPVRDTNGQGDLGLSSTQYRPPVRDTNGQRHLGLSSMQYRPPVRDTNGQRDLGLSSVTVDREVVEDIEEIDRTSTVSCPDETVGKGSDIFLTGGEDTSDVFDLKNDHWATESNTKVQSLNATYELSSYGMASSEGGANLNSKQTDYLSDCGKVFETETVQPSKPSPRPRLRPMRSIDKDHTAGDNTAGDHTSEVGIEDSSTNQKEKKDSISKMIAPSRRSSEGAPGDSIEEVDDAYSDHFTDDDGEDF